MVKPELQGYTPSPGILETLGLASILANLGLYTPPDTTELDGVKYEIHGPKTEAGGGAGFFRLTAEVDTNPALFTAIMMDAKILGELDQTVRCLGTDYVFCVE